MHKAARQGYHGMAAARVSISSSQRQGSLSYPASAMEALAYVNGKPILAINTVRRTHSQCVIQFPASKYHRFVQSVAEG
jgi:hypothetical protein